MTTQSDRQLSVEAVTGTKWTYNGDWCALFDLDGIPPGDFNERLLIWINSQLGSSFTEINGAMSAYAQSQGYSSWGAMGSFNAAGGGGPTTAILLEDGVSFLMMEDGVSYLLLEH